MLSDRRRWSRRARDARCRTGDGRYDACAEGGVLTCCRVTRYLTACGAHAPVPLLPLLPKLCDLQLQMLHCRRLALCGAPPLCPLCRAPVADMLSAFM